MAKNTQKARVDVFLNGEAAKNEIKSMKEQLEAFTKELERLQKTPVGAMKPGEVEKMAELRKETQKLEKQIKSTEDKAEAFARTLKNINSASLKDLQAAARRLSFEVKELAPGTQAFIEKSKQLQQVNTRIVQLRTSFKGVVEEQSKAAFTLRGLVDGFNKYWGAITMATGAVTGFSMSFRKAAQAAAELDDTYADVMKTTGLLHDEVADLDKELMKIDTRTSREQLLLQARDAGKLGIQGKEDILGFVRAADQIQVALGEDLGEGAIRNLGKIADVLGLTQSMGIEKSLLSIASAVNAVGQASTASEGYLVDFTQRLAGVAAQTGISAANIIGFASGLDQSAMKVEMASTAFQKFLMKLYEDPAKFASYANLEVGKFTELLQNDANQAVITILKALKDQDGFASLVPIFKDMGLDGARAVSVLAAMATNINAVTDAQALANEEFAKANSVTEEYNTKNNNMQAQLEKARKEFQNASIALGQSLNPVMLKSTKLTTHLIKALASYGKEIKAVLIVIAALTVALKARNIAIAIGNAAMKVAHALQATGKVITLALSVAYNTLANNTTRAAAAQKMLNATMSASVFGVVALAIGGLTAAITHWVKNSREANAVNERMVEIQKRINSEYAEGACKVQALTNIVHNNNLELDQRRRALDELKKIVPGYHANLTKEGQLINDNTDALKEYLINLEKATRAKVLQKEYEKAVSDVLSAEKTLDDATKAKDQALVNAGGDTSTIRAFTMQSTAGAYSVSEITPYGKALKEETAAQEDLNAKKTIQLEIEQRINNELGMKAGKLTEEEKAVKKINDKYKALFNDIREQYRDNPSAGDDRIAELEQQKKNEIASIRKNYSEKRTVVVEEETTTNAILTQTQFDYLEDRYDKLTKKEKAMVDAGYAALSAEDSKALKARYDKLMKADGKAADQRYQAEVKRIEQRQREEQNLINQQFFDREITAEQHEKALRDITMKYLVEKLGLAKASGKDITQIEASILGERMKNRKSDYDEDLKQLEARQKEEEQALSLSLSAEEITEKEYQAKSLELKMRYLEEKLKLTLESGQDETAVLQAIFDAQIEAEKAAYDEMRKLEGDAKKFLAELNPSEARKSELEEQLKRLEEIHDAKLWSEEQYEQAVQQLRKKYADEDLKERLANVQNYTEQANSIMSEASNFVTALKEAESAQLEAEYQKQLTAAGDNAEQREAIEADYEQKKLDLQKKYADTEMALNIAKAIASGALAAVEAFAAAGGNPVLGGIFAAIIAATTAIEIATIVSQRNAIKNASVSGGGSSSAPKTGERKMTGYSEGGYTGHAASDRKAVGVVHANEWVAPEWMVRRNPVTFASLEQYRKAGSHGHCGSTGSGFADGGFTGDMNKGMAAGITVAGIEAAVEAAFRRVMEDGAIRAYLVRKDLTELDAQTNKFKNMTSR